MDIAWYKNPTGECIINLYSLILEEQIKHREREGLKDILLYTSLFHKNIYKVYMLSFLISYVTTICHDFCNTGPLFT